MSGEREDAREVATALYELAGMRPDFPYWLVGADEGLDYCYECAKKRVDAGEAECVGGGYASEGADTSLACNDCGDLLWYWLSSYGVESELEHYKYWRFRRPLLKGDAYCISRILDSAPDDKRVRRLALRVAKHIPGASHD